jgi:hypothetical protein
MCVKSISFVSISTIYDLIWNCSGGVVFSFPFYHRNGNSDRLTYRDFVFLKAFVRHYNKLTTESLIERLTSNQGINKIN